MSRTQGQGSATRQPASTTARRLTAAVRFAALLVALLVAAGAAAATGLGMLAGPLAAPAGAHARLDGSHPSNGQRLEHLPHHVSVTLDAKPATLEGDPLAVYAPGGERIDTGQPWLEDDHETIGILLDPDAAGPEGDYELLYRVVSSDNHVISGRVAFTTTAAGPPEAGTTPEGAETESGEAPTAAGSGAGPGDGGDAGESSPVTQPAGVTTTIAPDDPHAEHLAASQASEPSEAVDDERPFMHGFDTDIRPRLAAVAIIVLLAVGVARRAVRRDGREPRGFAPGEARGGPSGPTAGRSVSSRPPAGSGSSGSGSSGAGSSGPSFRRSGAGAGFGSARRPATGPATTTGPTPAFRAGGGSHDPAAGWDEAPGTEADAPAGFGAPYQEPRDDATYGRPADETTPAAAAAARAGDLWSSLAGDDDREAELAAGLARFDADDDDAGHGRRLASGDDLSDESAEAGGPDLGPDRFADEFDLGRDDIADLHRADPFDAGHDATAGPDGGADSLEPQTFSWAPWAPANDLPSAPRHMAPAPGPERAASPAGGEAEPAARPGAARRARRRVDGPATPPGGVSRVPESEFEDFWMEADRKLTSRVERRAAARLTPPRGTPVARDVPTSFFAASGEAEGPAAPAPVPAAATLATPAPAAAAPPPADPSPSGRPGVAAPAWPPARGAVDGPPGTDPRLVTPRPPAAPARPAEADRRSGPSWPGSDAASPVPAPRADRAERPEHHAGSVPPARPDGPERPGRGAAPPMSPADDRAPARGRRREEPAASRTRRDQREATAASEATGVDERAARRRSPAPWYRTDELPAVAARTGEQPAVSSSAPPADAHRYSLHSGDVPAVPPAAPAPRPGSATPAFHAGSGEHPLVPATGPAGLPPVSGPTRSTSQPAAAAARPLPAPPGPAQPPLPRRVRDDGPPAPPPLPRRRASAAPAAGVTSRQSGGGSPEPGPRAAPGARPRPGDAAGAAPAFSAPADSAAPAREPLAGATPLGRRHAGGRPSVAPELTGPGGVAGPRSLEIPAVEWADDPLVSAYVADVAPAAPGPARTRTARSSWDEADRLAEEEGERARADRPAHR